LLSASSRMDCSSALHSRARPESCWRLCDAAAFSPLPLGVPFPLATAAPLEAGGATDATSRGAEYLGRDGVPFPFPAAAFWAPLCTCALTAELLLAFP
jgi:hypothetical protein